MITLLLCTFLLLSCQKPDFLTASHEPARIMQMDQADEALIRIAEDARSTLPGFFRQLTGKRTGEKSFCVKYPFPADEESGAAIEQIWITGIHFKNGRYHGVLTSTPRHISGRKKGDRVIFEADYITDWMYVQNGKIIGGYSIQYLLEKIPESQRSNTERELLLMFD